MATAIRERRGVLHLAQRDVAGSTLVSLSSSGQTAPNFWLDPRLGIQYFVAVQTPQYKIDTIAALEQTPIVSPLAPQPQLLKNLAQVRRSQTPANITHYQIQPTFDVLLGVQGTDLGSVVSRVDEIKTKAEAAMKDDPKLRVVLKEFPVLGPGSIEAAKVAVAVRMQDPGKKYFDFHLKLLGGRGQADKAHALAAAKEAGFDMARIEKDMASDEVKASIDESMKLAEALGLNGTPSYVVGSQVVVGAVGLDALKEKVNVARCGKATCS